MHPSLDDLGDILEMETSQVNRATTFTDCRGPPRDTVTAMTCGLCGGKASLRLGPHHCLPGLAASGLCSDPGLRELPAECLVASQISSHPNTPPNCLKKS